MRFIFLIGALLLFDWYVFQAIKTMAFSWTSPARTTFYVFYWVFTAFAVGFLAVGAMPNGTFLKKETFTFLRAFLLIAYLSKLLIATFLLIDDTRRLGMSLYEVVFDSQGFDYGRSKFLSTLGVLLASIPLISLTYGIVRNRYRYRIFKETISLKHLPPALKGLRIVQISDVHSGSFGMKEPVKGAIDLINAQNPDLVFFTGDLVNSVADEMDPFIDVFDKIKAKHGVFSILGNHDYGDYAQWPSPEAKAQNLNKLKATHGKLGWDLLLNEHRLLTINDEQLAIIGVENYSASRHFQKYGDLQKAYQGTENTPIKLLLSHDPTHWDSQVTTAFQDIDITFSGHTHGMQFGIEIPGWLRWSPAQYVYKQWAGLYQRGQQYLYVNRGLGFLGYPGRVGILPEITVIELS